MPCGCRRSRRGRRIESLRRRAGKGASCDRSSAMKEARRARHRRCGGQRRASFFGLLRPELAPFARPCMGEVKRRHECAAYSPHVRLLGGQFLCSTVAVSSSRPRSPRSAARSRRQGWPSVRQSRRLGVARPRLDGGEHGAKLLRSGTNWSRRAARRDPGLGHWLRMRDHRITLYPVRAREPDTLILHARVKARPSKDGTHLH